jgi:hypothetical protein
MMFRLLLFRLSRRRAVSTIIGGLIILTLILTALGTMVAVSQQYDQYQQTVNKMAEYRNQQGSENLVANSPGLTIVTSTTISGWGSGCTTTYNCYNMSLSNMGGVGVQIATIYINSTGTAGSGCSYSSSSPNPQPCILNPTSTIAPYAFNQANKFLNPGEVNHAVLLALPIAVTLPSLYYSQNSIFIVTSRGNVFSFQWPFPIQIFGGQSQSALSVRTVKVAYQDISATGEGTTNNLCTPPSGTDNDLPPTAKTATGCDSSHDYNGAPLNQQDGYCHDELEQPYVAPTNYAEKLTFPTGVVVGTTLYFVNPWVTNNILEDARTDESASNPPTTQMYIYVNITNTGTAPYTIAGGSLDLTYYGSNHMSGYLIGIYYGPTGNGQFYTASSTQTQTVAVGKSFYAIYKVTQIELGTADTTSPATWPPSSSAMFWGSLSLTNNLESTRFVGNVGLSSGLWIRYPGC